MALFVFRKDAFDHTALHRGPTALNRRSLNFDLAGKSQCKYRTNVMGIAPTNVNTTIDLIPSRSTCKSMHAQIRYANRWMLRCGHRIARRYPAPYKYATSIG